jgi:hypothetical protein
MSPYKQGDHPGDKIRPGPKVTPQKPPQTVGVPNTLGRLPAHCVLPPQFILPSAQFTDVPYDLVLVCKFKHWHFQMQLTVMSVHNECGTGNGFCLVSF